MSDHKPTGDNQKNHQDSPSTELETQNETNEVTLVDIREPSDNQLEDEIPEISELYDSEASFDSDGSELASEHPDDGFIPIDIVELPRVTLVRDGDPAVETLQFLPNSLLTLVIENTGDEMMTKVRMHDNINQIRYHSSSGGSDHEWTTRLQNTRSFGEWKFEVRGLLANNIDSFVMDIPFFLLPELDPDFKEVPYGLVEEEEEVVDPVEPVQEVEVETQIVYVEVPVPVEDDSIYKNTDLPDLQIPVNEIHGIGPTYKKKLEAKDIVYVEHLLEYEPESLGDLISVTVNKCRNWIAEAKDIANNSENETYVKYSTMSVILPDEIFTDPSIDAEELLAENDYDGPLMDITEIKGIGPSTKVKFASINIAYVHQLVGLDASNLSQKLSLSEKKIQGWIDQANEMSGSVGVPPGLLEEDESTFDKDEEVKDTSLPSTDEVDTKSINLPITVIKGIGPSFQKKFAEFGIEYVHHIAESSAPELAVKTRTSEKKWETWYEQATDIMNDPNHPAYQDYK